MKLGNLKQESLIIFTEVLERAVHMELIEKGRHCNIGEIVEITAALVVILE